MTDMPPTEQQQPTAGVPAAEKSTDLADQVAAMLAALDAARRPLSTHPPTPCCTPGSRRRSATSRATEPAGIVAPRVQRLDAELVRRGLARSREQARRADRGRPGRGPRRDRPQAGYRRRARTPRSGCVASDEIEPDYASRGGHKLAGALAAFPALAVAGRRCLDAGASTGGFTDVLLRAGAREVVAVDVGYGQLAWTLRTDERVTVLDRTNVRTLTPELIGGPVDADGRRPVVHLAAAGAARAGRVHRARRRPAADGQAAVRGGQGAARQRRRGARSGGIAPRPCSASSAAAAALGWRVAGVVRQPAAGPVRQRGILPVAAARADALA